MRFAAIPAWAGVVVLHLVRGGHTAAALAEEEPFPSVAQVASLLPELIGRPVPPQGEEIVHQLDWQCAEILGNWEELVLLMGHVSRQVETISDWWELRHAWRLHMGIVAAAAYRIGLHLGRDGQKDVTC